MSTYDAQVKEATLKAVSELSIDLGLLASERVKEFATAIAARILAEPFDIVISGGDSGLITTHLVTAVYAALQLPTPPIVVLPIQRYKNNDLTERFVHTDLQSYIPNLKSCRRVLFVDDEIRFGWTAKTCLTALQQKYPGRLECVIVAEHHFFEWQYTEPEVHLRFFAHAKVIPGVNQVFAHLISDAEYQFVQSLSPLIQDKQQAVAVLLTGTMKLFTGDSVYFEEVAAKEHIRTNMQFTEMQDKLDRKCRELVESAIERS